GSYELLRRCVDASGLPAIAKEFVVDPVQLRWAQDAGASAVLLIAALYDAATLRSLAVEARRLGLVPLVEVHDTDELARLEGSTWELVGVNNRDLRTFRVDLDTSRALLPLLPTGALCVAESGIHRGDDLRSLAVAGFDAFLIGESLLLADDPAAKLQELRGA
ncbi:MAG: indole-3-glycerol phosphate synthase TrpC, partial [Acidobacteriota bacterium]